MIIFAGLLTMAAFLVAFRGFAIVGAAGHAVSLAGGATGVLRDSSLSDDQKEAAVRRAALAMLRATGSIFWRMGATLICAIAPIFLLDALGLVDATQVTLFMARPDVMIGASVLVGAGMWLLARRPKVERANSFMDRALHRIAFAAPFVQMTAADIEDAAFAREARDIRNKPPVFITSLARAGTTVVLNALADVPGVATHLYRDMPFIMAPMMWARLSAGFQRAQSLRERAHHDGLQVGYDSPEAFEEVLWRQFWPKRFKQAQIPLWTGSDQNAEAGEFMRAHFRKIIALRTGANGRYVSKNNGNIARLDLLTSMFPGADIIVPIRHPAEHAASLLRQHENFLTQHKSDAFVRRYMQDIGHLEFGELHRPVAFDGLQKLTRGLDPRQPDYWLAYWIAAYRNVEIHADNLLIVTETALQSDPQAIMTTICAKLNLDPHDTDFMRHFKPIPPRARTSDFSAELLYQAVQIYRRLSDAGRLPLDVAQVG